MQDWSPSQIKRYIRSAASSTKVARVRTDAGDAYMKAMNNPEGPHALVREYVGTSLAKWFGLPTFEYVILEHDGVVDIPVGDGGLASAGPAFLTRAHEGGTWGGNASELEQVENLEVVTGLVVFDTWVRNRDRCPPLGMSRKPNLDNVFLSEECASPGKYRLVAMDFTHCFQEGTTLNRHISDIANVQDDRVYGLFTAFGDHMNTGAVDEAIRRMGTVNDGVVTDILDRIPEVWQLDTHVKNALRDFIVRRARYLEVSLYGMLFPYLGQQDEMRIN